MQMHRLTRVFPIGILYKGHFCTLSISGINKDVFFRTEACIVILEIMVPGNVLQGMWITFS